MEMEHIKFQNIIPEKYALFKALLSCHSTSNNCMFPSVINRVI
jgi:hypothetical protein